MNGDPIEPQDAAPALMIRLPQLDIIEARLMAVLEGRHGQAWYTLEQAWRRKFASSAGDSGAISFGSVKNEQALQPKGGLPDAWMSNKKVWSEVTVEEWCLVDDASLESYLRKTNPIRKVPQRIKDALQRRPAIASSEPGRE